ncbi:MAG: carboxylating nicotinate-nucleotide diphosphorylase [Oscillospiraceae bacterium]|nr:carboxylating nicotinate-nucleotide diphosphorylase [Oscillospiraceae bacterium]
MNLPNFYIDDIIKRALEEDINYVDLATDYLLDDEDMSSASFIAKAEGVLCGINAALRVFTFIDSEVKTEIKIKDGEPVKKGDVIAVVSGRTKSILKGERTSLNILQHMSGVASETAKYVKCCEGTKCTVADTRKTLPGLRSLEKYAVTVGGGRNHRFNLSDGAMLKDNHIDAYGSLTNAVAALRAKIGHMVKIEVEVRNQDELREALSCAADVIMLDNMTPAEMTECVKIVDEVTAGKFRPVIEASGNITLANAAEIAKTGVDLFSVGALTHSVKAFDISLRINK